MLYENNLQTLLDFKELQQRITTLMLGMKFIRKFNIGIQATHLSFRIHKTANRLVALVINNVAQKLVFFNSYGLNPVDHYDQANSRMESICYYSYNEDYEMNSIQLQSDDSRT